ncbi:MAG: hypothetical protein Q4G60_03575 [bacterium]|nr:hypothetical protein [bacterium]
MELLVYLGIIIVGILVIFVNGAISERKRYRLFLWSLDEKYGKFPDRKYEDGDMTKAAAYYRSQPVQESEIDDITWNDLDMDRIYQRINSTFTSAGEEYLYYLLRMPLLDQNELEKRDQLIRFTMENAEKRKTLQKILYGVGKVQRISLTEYLILLGDVDRESNFKHYLMDALIVITFCLIFVSPGWGALAFMISLAYSIIWYYRRRGSISPYITTFNYIIKMLGAVNTVNGLNYEELKPYCEQTSQTRETFKNFKRNSFLIAAGVRMSDNIIDLMLDYLRMIFHLDIIKFNSMLKQLQDHYDQIYILRDVIGLLDSAIAVGSYREALTYYSKPDFVEWDEHSENKVYLSAEDVYHPLIDEPVVNSITEERGVLLTGSNASGKSTFLKTIAINAILSQTIDTALAKTYKANMFYIYSSMALRDDIMSSESYFIVEIKSLKRILDAGRTQGPVLCFIDEVLRGTNTVERIAASAKIMESLAKDHILCFAATHDIELTQLLEQQYSNYHFQEEIEENDIHFNYQLFQGRATTRNAIKLLSVIGYDSEIIEAAERVAENFVHTGNWKM